MKKALLLLVLLFTPSLFAQEVPKTQTFNRLLIFNERNELMVVKIKNRDLWVTPGWYQDDHLTIKEGLDGLFASYGIKSTPLTLRGVFTLKGSPISTRLVYSATIKGRETKMSEIVDEIRWLPTQKAIELITLPHIRTQISQITRHPSILWGGSQTISQENGVYGSKIIENFYPLSSTAERQPLHDAD